MAAEIRLAAQVLNAQDRALRVFRATAALADPPSAEEPRTYGDGLGESGPCEACGGTWHRTAKGYRGCRFETCKFMQAQEPKV